MPRVQFFSSFLVAPSLFPKDSEPPSERPNSKGDQLVYFIFSCRSVKLNRCAACRRQKLFSSKRQSEEAHEARLELSHLGAWEAFHTF